MACFVYLPDDLLILIFACIDSRSVLRAIARACRRFHGICEPFLYKRVTIHGSDDRASFALALDRDPQRALLVRTFESLVEDSPISADTDAPTVAQLLKLEHVRFASQCQSDADDHLDWPNEQTKFELVFQRAVFPPPADRILTSLQSCYLHYSDNELGAWPLSQRASVLLHPTLRSLTLCLAGAVDGELDDLLDRHRGTTALEELRLSNCDLGPETLATILVVPRALKKLTWEEPTHELLQENLAFDVNSYAHAFERAKDSLESLSYLPGLEMENTAMALHNLTALKYLEVWPDHLFGKLNPVARTPAAYPPLTEILPPQLEALKLTSCSSPKSENCLFDILRGIAAERVAPKLRKVVLDLDDNSQGVPTEVTSELARAGIEIVGVQPRNA